MEANTAYTDVFQAYEYVLNRLEGRFEPQLMGNRNVRPDEEEWTAEIMAYIMDTDEPMVVNERVQSVVGQLPIRLTRNKFFAMVEEGMSVYKADQPPAWMICCISCGPSHAGAAGGYGDRIRGPSLHCQGI